MYTHSYIALFILGFSLCCTAKPLIPRNHSALSPNVSARTNSVVMERAAPQPSSYPWASASDPVLPNEFKWVNWDVNNADDERDGKRIHQAFREWVDFVKAGIRAARQYQDPPPANALYKRWFGSPTIPDLAGEVKEIFENMYDLEADEATDNIAAMILDREDFWSDPAGRCSARPNMNAYTLSRPGRFHFCPRGINWPLQSEIRCEDLDSSVSLKMRTPTSTFLHETTHYEQIDPTNDRIKDLASGASDCFTLKDDDKALNAQNYAWFASDAYWSVKCSKTFEDPPPGTTDDDEFESDSKQPSQASTSAAPSPTPTPSSTSAPSPLTRALGIVIEAPDSYDAESHAETAWLFFTTDYGHTVDCRADTDTVLNFARPENLDQPAVYPGGTYDLKLDGKDCQYKNDGTNSGRIFCGDTQIACYDDPAHKPGVNINRSNIDGDNYMCGLEYRQPMFTCPW